MSDKLARKLTLYKIQLESNGIKGRRVEDLLSPPPLGAACEDVHLKKEKKEIVYLRIFFFFSSFLFLS